MPRSMTAYGRGAGPLPAGPAGKAPDTSADGPGADAGLVWELRSVNHRFLELALHLPEALRAVEPAARARLRARVRRGKLDATLRSSASGAPRTLDTVALDALVADIARVRERVPDARAPDALELLRHPGVLVRASGSMSPSGDDGGAGPADGDEGGADDALARAVLDALDTALDDFLGTREREGAALAEVIRARATAVRRLVAGVRARRPATLAAARDRVAARLAELVDGAEAGAGLPDGIDAGRLEQELALLATRSDVEEELDRLDHHVDELDAALSRAPDEPVGRRLDFLVQEFHREANTLASKAADVATTDAALGIRVLVEQMREQVQNLE